MPANIAFAKMYGGVRQAAWHKLGQTWDAPKSPWEAVQAIGGDVLVHKMPLSTGVPVLGGMDGYTMPFPIENRFALMREPIPGIDDAWQFFGIVGSEYEVVQNGDVAAFLEPLAERWPVETVGLLGKGEEIFMTLTLGEWEVKGEAIQEYFLIHNGSTGSMGLSLAYTPIRVVCQNTLSMGLAAATVKANLAHRPGVKEEVEFRMKLTADLQRAQIAGRDAFAAMADAALNVEDVQHVLGDLYPLPRKPRRVELAEQADVSGASAAFAHLLTQAKYDYERAHDRAQHNRAEVAGMYARFNDEFPATANTPWALFNSVVEYADFRPSRNGEAQYSSALFGGRAKEKEAAFRLCYEAATH